MNRAKLLVSSGGLLCAIAAIGLTRNLDFWSGYSPGPAMFPMLGAFTCGAMAILAMAEARREPANTDVLDKSARLRVALSILAIWGFAFLIERIGFLLDVVLLMSALLLGVLRQPVLPSLLTIAVTTGLLHLIFIEWLHLSLPTGPFGF